MSSLSGHDKNDLTQQLITNCFEIMTLSGNPEKKLLHRGIPHRMDQARHLPLGDFASIEPQITRRPASSSTGIVFRKTLRLETRLRTPNRMHLRETARKGAGRETIFPRTDVKLLRAYEIEGVPAKNGPARGPQSKALSHRCAPGIQRLNQAFIGSPGSARAPRNILAGGRTRARQSE